MLSEMLIQKIILLLDKISILQLRKLRNQIFDVFILTEIMLIASQNSDHNLIKIELLDLSH